MSEWPENGGEWSDEDGPNMDCGLLQAMAEEDEEINVYNEETFGMGVFKKQKNTHKNTGLPFLRFRLHNLLIFSMMQQCLQMVKWSTWATC